MIFYQSVLHILYFCRHEIFFVLWYGFKELVSDFLIENPGHHINLKGLNGSAVETVFGQLKYITGGQLTAETYETAKASLLTKQCVHGTHTHGTRTR